MASYLKDHFSSFDTNYGVLALIFAFKNFKVS